MSATATPLDPVVFELLREAACWRLLGRLFECPTDPWRIDVTGLAAEIDDVDLQAAADAAVAQAAEGLYHAAFGPGGPAPPREASYQDTLELGSLMSSLCWWYDAFGYRTTLGEPPDHVAVEAGFLSYLCLKQAHAWMSGEGAHAQVAAEAMTRFRSAHLAMMAAPLAEALAGSGIEYLARASHLLAARVGPKPKSGRLPVIQDDPCSDDVCGEEI